MKSVSNAFVGYISPFTLNNDTAERYDDLYFAVKEVQKIGVPKHWLPICEDNGDYYCITEDGKIRFWDHNGSSNEYWPSLAVWAKEVWLDGG